MLSLSTATRVFVALAPVDLRGSFNRLAATVQTVLEGDPLLGHLFVFTNRQRNRLKILFWDGTGLWVCAKRLERGRFSWPAGDGASMPLRNEELTALITGWKCARKRGGIGAEKSFSFLHSALNIMQSIASYNATRMSSGPSVILPATLPEAHAYIVKLAALVEQCEWRIKQLEKQLYGSSADRAPQPETLSTEQILFSLFPAPAEPPATADVLIEVDPTEKPEPRPRRQPAARVLETVSVRIEPEEKICPHCGKDKCEIGCEKSERYEYVPAKIIRQEISRPKLACPCGQGTVSVAPMPPSVVDKGLPGPALVAHVILNKFESHLPLERQRKEFERLGVYFPQQTLCDWVEHGARWLQPLARQIKTELLAGDYLQVDETPVRVMDPEVKGRCGTGWLWVGSRPGGDVLFEFHPGRGKDYAKALLGDFKGFLQRDGYGVYGSLAAERPELTPVGCWAHARRKFVEAMEERPTEVGPIVTEIRKLYLIEKRARDETLDVQERFKLRTEMALPILTALKPRLEALQPTCLPQSPTGKAIRYALNEWAALTRYVEDGRLEIDNNLTENAIRPSAVGKKNWLFIGHPEAGWRSAVIYTILGSCRRHGIDPWEYLTDMFTRLPSARSDEIASLVPSRWRATTNR